MRLFCINLGKTALILSVVTIYLGIHPRIRASKYLFFKVEKILKDSLDSIPSPSLEIQIMGGKVSLR